MAAARYSEDVLEEFFGQIPRRENVGMGEPLISAPEEPLDENGFVTGECQTPLETPTIEIFICFKWKTEKRC